MEVRSPDNYCGFCSDRCFPAANTHGRIERVSMAKGSRLKLHSMRGADHGSPRAAGEAKDAMRREMAGAAVDTLAPFFEHGSKALLGLLKRKLAGDK